MTGLLFDGLLIITAKRTEIMVLRENYLLNNKDLA